MNIFFLSWDPKKCAELYCDQHVNKILLEIVQMLYTAWHCTNPEHVSHAPPRNDGHKGYKPVSNRNHAMVMWVRSHKNNYRWACLLGICLSKEFYKRYKKEHSCFKHIVWLFKNIPPIQDEIRNNRATYSTTGFPTWVTPVPQCMPDEYKDPHLIVANFNYYRGDKLRFARWSFKK